MIELFYWFMFLIALVFSTISIMAGIGGAILFAPFFLLVLGLDPVTAITAGLVIELFGFGSGLTAFLRRKLVNFHVVHQLFGAVILGALLGIVVRTVVPDYFLTFLLTMFLFVISFLFLSKTKKAGPRHPLHIPHIHLHFFHELPHIHPTIKFLTFIGSMLVTSISTGLGEINEYNFNERLKLPFAVAAGTSIFLVTMAALVGTVPHLFLLSVEAPHVAKQLFSILLFTLPGVVIGAQFGVYFSKKVRFKFVEHTMGVVFFFIALALLYSMFF